MSDFASPRRLYPRVGPTGEIDRALRFSEIYERTLSRVLVVILAPSRRRETSFPSLTTRRPNVPQRELQQSRRRRRTRKTDDERHPKAYPVGFLDPIQDGGAFEAELQDDVDPNARRTAPVALGFERLERPT
jgi:hypothetical protein